MKDPLRIPITVSINGRQVETEIEPREILLDFLRDHLNLTGTKRSCDIQICGACTVLLDGQPVSACNTLAYETNGRNVLTIESLAQSGELHVIQEAFIKHNALQCGFCTPGMVMSAVALLAENGSPSEAEIHHYLHGNLCRCTGYYPIVEAVKDAAQHLQNGEIDYDV